MVTWVAPPAVIVIVPEVAAVSPVALKLKVRSPATPVIDRFVKLATPLPFVVAVSVPPSVPPPVAIAAVTVTPVWLTALPLASRSCTTGCCADAAPLWALLDGCVVMLSWLAAPAAMLMVAEVAGVSPVAEKVNVRSPAAPVIDRFVKLATPLAFVVAVSVPPRVPPPVAIVAVTFPPDWLTGLPLASRSCSTGCWANATPLCAALEGWVVMLSCVAAPAVMVMAVDAALANPVAEKLNVRSPATPVIDRFVKRATPLPFVVAVSVPPRLPPPVAIAAVTVTPVWLTALPLASRSCTTGCCAKATPLWALLDGCVVMLSCVAAPAVAVALKVTGDPAAVACTVCVPAAVPNVQAVVAMPLALLVDVVGLTDPLPLAGVHDTVTPATGLLN